MTKEEKDLLFKDLCARLPYNVQGVTSEGVVSPLIVKGEADRDIITSLNYRIVKYGWKPYLRPMSSMTEEENKQRKELSILLWYNSNGERGFDGFGEISGEDVLKAVDWLNAHHFDYRGLMPKGLAIEAPEGMYEI